MALRNIVKDYKNIFNHGKRAFSCQSDVAKEKNDRSDVKKATHTGQVFEKDDYRNVRFLNAKRYVNENWGIDLINEVPPKEVTERVVWCDGGDPNLGHPKVYINLDKPGAHICGYCGLRYIKKDDHHH